MVIKEAKWEGGHSEYRISTQEPPSEEYQEWAESMLGEYDEENEEYEYSYDEGCAP